MVAGLSRAGSSASFVSNNLLDQKWDTENAEVTASRHDPLPRGNLVAAQAELG